MEPRPKKLLDQVCDAIRLKQHSYRTEQSYVAWIRRYILFHNKQHPAEMGIAEIEAFLSHLAVIDQVSASTQLHRQPAEMTARILLKAHWQEGSFYKLVLNLKLFNYKVNA